MVCTAGGSLPLGYSATPVHAPVAGLVGANVSDVGGSGARRWTQQTDALVRDGAGAAYDFRHGTARALKVWGFGFTAPPNSVLLGVQARIVEQGMGVRDSTVYLIDGMTDVILGTNQATTTGWPTTWADAVYGGPTNLWGSTSPGILAHLSTLGVVVTPLDTASNSLAEVDSISLRLFFDVGSFDCAPMDATSQMLLSGYVDQDGDSHGAGSAATTCVGWDLPPRTAVRGGDCDDANANVFPGQTAYFTTPRANGSYDYDCDVLETQRTYSDCSSCVADATNTFCQSSCAASPVAACGVTGSHQTCSAVLPCSLAPSSLVQPCR